MEMRKNEQHKGSLVIGVANCRGILFVAVPSGKVFVSV